MTQTRTANEHRRRLEAAGYGIERLLTLMQILRGPGGCPWDHKQTHARLAKYALEEAYELVDAIDAGDDTALRGELGDVLLQVVFHAQLASETGRFNFNDVAEQEAWKMAERHPHVFGDTEVYDADAVLQQWHRNKRRDGERIDTGVPRALPALVRAQTVLARGKHQAPKNPTGALDTAANTATAAGNAGKDQQQRAIGDLLWATAALAAEWELDAEACLREAITRFVEQAHDAKGGTKSDGTA